MSSLTITPIISDSTGIHAVKVEMQPVDGLGQVDVRVIAGCGVWVEVDGQAMVGVLLDEPDPLGCGDPSVQIYEREIEGRDGQPALSLRLGRVDLDAPADELGAALLRQLQEAHLQEGYG